MVVCVCVMCGGAMLVWMADSGAASVCWTTDGTKDARLHCISAQDQQEGEGGRDGGMHALFFSPVPSAALPRSLSLWGEDGAKASSIYLFRTSTEISRKYIVSLYRTPGNSLGCQRQAEFHDEVSPTAP